MPILNETINEFDVDRAHLTLKLAAIVARMRRVIPRSDALVVPDFETRAPQRGVSRRLCALLSRDGDVYHVEVVADRHAYGSDARFTAYEARVVVGSRGSWRIGLDLRPTRETLIDGPALERLHRALERVFGVAGEAATYLPDAPEPSVRATLAGEG